jgi:AcrR family transcriptional regulator
MKLLETKPLSDISVSEITSKAGVSRMTYYRNYQTKEEIFSSHLQDILEVYRQELQELNQKADHEVDFYDYQNLLHCFVFFKQHEAFMQILFKSGMSYMLLRGINQYLLDTYYQNSHDMELYYQLQSFSGSLCNTFVAWLQRDTKESAEDVAKYLWDIYNSPAK